MLKNNNSKICLRYRHCIGNGGMRIKAMIKHWNNANHSHRCQRKWERSMESNKKTAKVRNNYASCGERFHVLWHNWRSEEVAEAFGRDLEENLSRLKRYWGEKIAGFHRRSERPAVYLSCERTRANRAKFSRQRFPRPCTLTYTCSGRVESSIRNRTRIIDLKLSFAIVSALDLANILQLWIDRDYYNCTCGKRSD